MNKHSHTQNIEQKAGAAPAAVPFLPQDKSKALNLLIRLTQNLSNLADREAMALAQNDMLTFSILQDEKNLVAEQYMGASEELRLNLSMYRGADPALLDRLQNLQNDLGTKTKDNNETVHRIYNNAQAKTQSSLITAQALGQEKYVQFPAADKAVNENSQRAGA